MEHLRIADLLHPDTINFLLEASGLAELTKEETAGPLLVRPDGDDWIVIVAQPELDNYLRVPVLRRLRRQKGGLWRHFPMAPCTAAALYDWETDGVPVPVQALAELPAWTCRAAFAALPELQAQLVELSGCLGLCARFPRMHALALVAARLRFCIGQQERRSRELQEQVLLAEECLALACPGRFGGPSAAPAAAPSSWTLSNSLAEVYRTLRDAEIQIGTTPVSDAFHKALERHFLLEKSLFPQVAKGLSGSPADPKSWSGKDKVKLYPQALDRKGRGAKPEKGQEPVA